MAAGGESLSSFLGRRLTLHLATLCSVTPGFARFVGAGAGGGTEGAGTGEDDIGAAFLSLADALAEVNKPLLVTVEGMETLDPDSLRLLSRIGPELGARPLLIIGMLNVEARGKKPKKKGKTPEKGRTG